MGLAKRVCHKNLARRIQSVYHRNYGSSERILTQQTWFSDCHADRRLDARGLSEFHVRGSRVEQLVQSADVPFV